MMRDIDLMDGRWVPLGESVEFAHGPDALSRPGTRISLPAVGGAWERFDEGRASISAEAVADRRACEEGFELAYSNALAGRPMELARHVSEAHERHELVEAWAAAYDGRPAKVELARHDDLSPDARAAREAAERWIGSDL